jgi:UDP-GlcNAc:undecaprenyl-phosphate GlcNAc-1-phosphate transferase
MALGLTPLALRFALRKQVLDRPGDYKMQESPVPYLGGLAIVVAFSGAIMLATLISPPPGGVRELAVLLGISILLSLVGLADDIRGSHPLPRFAIEVGAALVVWWSGVGITLFGSSFANALLTVIWIVGITNAFNLLDNMDGLSAGIAAIAAFTFFVLAVSNQQTAVAGLSIALGGCALGFLRSNFHPARIYMGDAGSLFFGFLLSVIGIKLRFEAPREITFMVPILVLGVAIMDTTLVVTSRLAHRLSPFAGGRDHISHRLVFVGISVPSSVALIYAAGVAMGWLAIVMARLDLGTGLILMGFVVSVASFGGVMLGLVPVYDGSRRRRLMLTQVVEQADRSGGAKDEVASEPTAI